ncbi:MAG: hypothetical protein ACRD10_02570 [Terriglobia bacterium]
MLNRWLMRFLSSRVPPWGSRAGLYMVGLAVIAVLALQPALAQAQRLPPASHVDPAAHALLDQAIRALGGPAFLNFQTVSTEGRAFSISDGVTNGFVHYESDEQFPEKRRLSYGLGKKKEITLINNGDQGWEIDKFGLIEQTGTQIDGWKRANRYGLASLLRRVSHEPGTLIQNGGQDFVENQAAAIVAIMDVRQVDVKVYLDNQTHLPIQVAYRLLNPATHEWDDYVEIYADYQRVQGIDTPMHLVRYVNGDRAGETFRFRVQYGQTYSQSIFQPAG